MARCEYCNREMLIAKGCVHTALAANDAVYVRIKYGAPGDLLPISTSNRGNRCHDCFAKPGHLHHYGCDAETCPVCAGQLLSCGCMFDKLTFVGQKGAAK